MGAKPTKEDVQNVASSVGRVRGLSKEDLAGCVASLADMAHTGINMSLPEVRINDQSANMAAMPSNALHMNSIQRQVRARLQRQMATGEEPSFHEDVSKQLQLLDFLESQEDDTDWASMRRWLVWCLHSNLDDKETEEEIDMKRTPPPRTSPSVPSNNGRLLRRQAKVEVSRTENNRGAFKTKKNSSLSLDSDKSSSGQNSFDSCTNAYTASEG